MRLLADGFAFPEAPCVLADGRLAFSDVVKGGIFALDTDGTTTELLPRRRGVGGLVAHADGGVVMTGRDLRHMDGDEQRLVLDPPEGIAWRQRRRALRDRGRRARPRAAARAVVGS